MKIIASLFALSCVLVSAPGIAEETPHPTHLDRRIRVINYNAAQVFRIDGTFRHTLAVQFSADETITQAALGDTVSWEIAPVGNILFLKPREKAKPTNLIVLTSVNGATRSYQFELRMNARTAMYGVRFKYPDQESRANVEIDMLNKMRAAAQVENGVVNQALDHAVIEGTRNLDYWLQGASELAPSEISDNGEFTAMRYVGHADIPSIFGVNPDGSETIIPYDVRDDFVVIHAVYKQLRLRRGDLVLCITNGAKPRNEREARTGTVSPLVERTIKGDVK